MVSLETEFYGEDATCFLDVGTETIEFFGYQTILSLDVLSA